MLADGKLCGVYLGKVLKHLPHGRCKIFIPSVYAEKYEDKPDLLPSAQQAAPLFAGSNAGNGVFSYPNIGATVWCLFVNGDANLPVYIASVLGSENAFGQYSIIKKDLKEENGRQIDSKEDVSERHLVTSGKTHIEWYENGKISAIVEDPIRTICSVDYDSWEKGNDNISADDKYQSKLSNDNVWKIRDNKLSNIDCQLVLDNDGDTFGQLSTSTHRYNIIDSKDEKTGVKKNGKLSIDNWNIMRNDGKIKIGTLSTITAKTESKDEIAEQKNQVKNIYELFVPGVSNSSVKNTTDRKVTNIPLSSYEDLKHIGYSNLYFDHCNNYHLTGFHKDTKNSITNQLTVSLTSKISNEFQFEEDGSFWLSSKYQSNSLCMGQITDNDVTPALDPTEVSEDEEYEDEDQDEKKKAVNIIKKIELSSILSSKEGNSAFETISAANIIDGADTINSNISNQILMKQTGNITLNTKSDVKKSIGGTVETIVGQIKSNLDSESGFYGHLANWKYSNSDSKLNIKNGYSLNIFNHYDASIEESFKSEKKESGSKVVDFAFAKNVVAQSSTFNITVDDKIAMNKYTHVVDCMKGEVDIQIVSNKTGNTCVITFDSNGVMTVTTTDKLDIKTTNSVTITTPQTTINSETTINGATTINSTLHVTSQTTIDADAVIGGKSFLGHMHVGNMGAATSPPI